MDYTTMTPVELAAYYDAGAKIMLIWGQECVALTDPDPDGWFVACWLEDGLGAYGSLHVDYVQQGG
jgi:hypothetical protein